VALARALVVEPRVLLLDEPLSSLDASLRDEMRELICRLQRELSVTTIFVTHSQTEAVQLADRIALMFEGRIVQIGSSREFYDQPANPTVAAFFGNPNVFPGRKVGEFVETGLGRLRATCDTPTDGPVHLYVRPEAVTIGTRKPASENVLSGTLVSCAYLGTHTRYIVRTGSVHIEARGNPVRYCPEPGDDLWVRIPPESVWLTRTE
jgi:ABC-type Fe3+/spermidine/putrescine transport system ATPase subunit